MAAFDDEAVTEFLRKSYFAADGLWFLEVEKAFSYEDALRLDEQVWEVLPKIQARKAKQILGIEGNSLAELALALWLRFRAEGYEHLVIEKNTHWLRIELPSCPWYEAVMRSGRESIACDVCERICTRDYSGWAAQFSEDISFCIEQKLSEGAPACRFVFSLPQDVQVRMENAD